MIPSSTAPLTSRRQRHDRHAYSRTGQNRNHDTLLRVTQLRVARSDLDQVPLTPLHRLYVASRRSVHLDYPYPDAERDLNRWLPLVKWFLAIPHFVALIFLEIAAIVVVVVAWFAILFTGRYPRGMFDFVQGVIRWHNRVSGYALVLVTDRYPPFSVSS